MRAGRYFDQILGEQNMQMDIEAQEAVKNYILNHEENQSEKNIIDRMKIGLQIEMWEYLNAEQNSLIITSGEFLNRLLGIYKISKTRFSEYIQLERTNLHAIIKGDRKFNSLLANKIEQIFNIPTELWLHIETKNELAKFRSDQVRARKRYTLEKLLHVR